MSQIKPSDHGIVVENKESGVTYAVTDANYDAKTERKVRDLKAGESVLSFEPYANDSSNEDETTITDASV